MPSRFATVGLNRLGSMPQSITLSLLGVVAVALVILGVSWKWLYPVDSYWSEEKSQALLDAFDAVHAAEDEAVHGSNTLRTSGLLAARRRYDAMKSELNQARTARDRTGAYLASAGLALLLSVFLLLRFGTPPSAEQGN